MRRLPDVQSLSRAKTETVLKLWEGLGYYRRAFNLQRAARELVERHDGRFPCDFKELLALPGIGRYTAGAICSIAFDQPTPVLDGNVVRVLSRSLGLEDCVRRSPAKARLWEMSEKLVSAAAHLGQKHHRPCASLNQALMELGATICTPRRPQCPRCPLRAQCVARLTGRVENLPNLGARPKPTRRHFVAFVVEQGDRVLVRQRPPGMVNAGLWEFPNLERNGQAARVRELAKTCLGWTPAGIFGLCRMTHTITRFRIKLDVYRALLPAPVPADKGAGAWLTLRQLRNRAFPSAHLKILRALENRGA
jgi:A/G-specific adenine glycosylase